MGVRLPSQLSCAAESASPLPSSTVNPTVWDISNPIHANTLLVIHLKHPSLSPYPIAPKHQQGLKPIICCLLSNGSPKVTHSPFNSTIVPILTSNGFYHQSKILEILKMQLIVSVHLVVPNAYAILSFFFVYLSLFCIIPKWYIFNYFLTPQLPRFLCLSMDKSRHCNLHNLFRVLPQGFMDTPHFSWAPAADLVALNLFFVALNLKPDFLLQYTDELLLYSPVYPLTT